MDTKTLMRFKRLSKQGLTREQIMERMSISARTYYVYKKEAEDKRTKICKIDKEGYYRLVMNGYDTKVD